MKPVFAIITLEALLFLTLSMLLLLRPMETAQTVGIVLLALTVVILIIFLMGENAIRNVMGAAGVCAICKK